MFRLQSSITNFAFFFSFACMIMIGLLLNEGRNQSLIEEIPSRQAVADTKPMIIEENTTHTMNNQKTSFLKKETNSGTSNNTAPQIMIYHSHNRESWIPELDHINSPDQAFDSEINVTLLGSYLLNKLKSSDIPVFHSNIDYPSRISNFNYAKSYSYSKQTITQELKMHQNVKYLFDLHRDSQEREKTTILFKNQNYAQVYFVVGTNHPNWKQNMNFAERIQESLNERIPNLSKGIYQKDKTSGNGEYNQSLSGNSALIEIGGVENSLEESYRTIEVLAKVIQDIWLEDRSQLAVSSPSV
ncbi:stage II sporulation protein P [Paenibacillus alkaliterrae]|uniref:stage II sporulation protein P n=1 Tax=Paenibacillus alkaliterrae TaxID=320909 RepID=UPI001F2C4069|nr:stage II sporulation protein P [Paenibacillus alkaliterrae]MCF2941884.1 stage II sporulation protein P [Paenibacillus alkaliterrae]